MSVFDVEEEAPRGRPLQPLVSGAVPTAAGQVRGWCVVRPFVPNCTCSVLERIASLPFGSALMRNPEEQHCPLPIVFMIKILKVCSWTYTRTPSSFILGSDSPAVKGPSLRSCLASSVFHVVRPSDRRTAQQRSVVQLPRQRRSSFCVPRNNGGIPCAIHRPNAHHVWHALPDARHLLNGPGLLSIASLLSVVARSRG